MNYLNKKKFTDYEYIYRTFYTPRNLCNIIKAYESIERKINYSWTESQKCMFVYKSLADAMHYTKSNEAEYVDNVDVARSLNGLLYKRAVCSGFALIFKEAMDRIGIECYYQNKSHDHSWNGVMLDGKYYLVDLTWDVCNKTDECGFMYFCRQDGKTFYSNKHHDISNEKEEIVLPAKAMDIDKLRDDYSKILNSKTIYSKEMMTYTNSSGETYNYMLLGEKNGILTYVIRHNDDIDCFYINKDSDIRRALTKEILNTASSSYEHDIKRFARYQRRDGSNFLLCKTSTKLKNGINEYIIIEPTEKNGKPCLKRSTILSENDLINVNEPHFKHVIADYLLSEDRLKRKINYYNGYVGYATNNSEVYYNRDFEIAELGIQNRL